MLLNLFLYEPTLFTKAGPHRTHRSTYIEVPTWASQPIDNKLGIATYKLFNVEGTAIFTTK